MSISITRNPDGSIAVSCGTDSVIIPAAGPSSPLPTGPGGPIVVFPPTAGGGGVTTFRLKTVHTVAIGSDKDVPKAFAGLSVTSGDGIMVTVGSKGIDVAAVRHAVDMLGVAVAVGLSFREDDDE